MGETSAVVIGASIAGLLAASTLAGSFERVTVLDRDTLPDEPIPRQGVPQSRHVHGLHARGVAALNELLPGLRDEMLAAGAGTGDAQRDVAWYLEGYRMASAPLGLSGIGLTRRRLELMIRQRVSQLPGVRIIDSTAADSLLVTGGLVTGVRVRPGRSRDGEPAHAIDGEDAVDAAPDAVDAPGDADADADPSPGTGTGTEEIAADLVVDASGRGSRTLAWLGELGFPQPQVSEIRANVVYLSRYYQGTPGDFDGLFSVVRVPYPGSPRFGAILRQEGSQWALLLGGMLGDEPPLDDAGLLEYAGELGSPEITSLVSSAAPLDGGVKMRFPGNVRRHYETLSPFPGNLIVTGDALCSFNPVYGQGITVAALEALALRDALSATGKDGVPARFFKAASKIVDGAWAMSAGNDLRFPEVEGKRQPGSGLVEAYMARYRAAMSVDPGLGAAFVRVANSLDSPTKLMTPGAMVRVFRAARKAGPPAVTPSKTAAAPV